MLAVNVVRWGNLQRIDCIIPSKGPKALTLHFTIYHDLLTFLITPASTLLPNTVKLAYCEWHHFWLGALYSVLAHLYCNAILFRSGIATYHLQCLDVSVSETSACCLLKLKCYTCFTPFVCVFLKKNQSKLSVCITTHLLTHFHICGSHQYFWVANRCA